MLIPVFTIESLPWELFCLLSMLMTFSLFPAHQEPPNRSRVSSSLFGPFQISARHVSAWGLQFLVTGLTVSYLFRKLLLLTVLFNSLARLTLILFLPPWILLSQRALHIPPLLTPPFPITTPMSWHAFPIGLWSALLCTLPLVLDLIFCLPLHAFVNSSTVIAVSTGMQPFVLSVILKVHTCLLLI